MKEYATDFFFHLFFRPLGMLLLKKGGFVTANGPIKVSGSHPALLRRHAPKHCNLFRSGFFIC